MAKHAKKINTEMPNDTRKIIDLDRLGRFLTDLKAKMTTTASAGLIPKYKTGGRLSVNTAVDDDDAVNKEQMDEELDEKLDKQTGNSQVYVNDSSGNPGKIAFAETATANSFPKRNANSQFSVGTPTDNSHVATKKYVDDAVIAPGFVTKTYVDQQDAATLQSAKDYSDDNLDTAKDYADTQDATTLQSAKDYADDILDDAKDYADTQDATTLQSSKDYTDDALDSAKDYTDSETTRATTAEEALSDRIDALEVSSLPAIGQYIALDGTASDPTVLFPNTTWEQLKGMFPRAVDDGESINPSISVSDGGVDSYTKGYGISKGEWYGSFGHYATSSTAASDRVYEIVGDTGWQQKQAHIGSAPPWGYLFNTALRTSGQSYINMNVDYDYQEQTHQNRPKFKNMRWYRRIA